MSVVIEYEKRFWVCPRCRELNTYTIPFTETSSNKGGCTLKRARGYCSTHICTTCKQWVELIIHPLDCLECWVEACAERPKIIVAGE